MALLTSEIQRIRAELGYNLLTVDAAFWISTTQAFEQIIQPFMTAGASTTSSTNVTASSNGATSPVALTLASASGVAANCRLVIDVDDRQEVATVQSLSGAVATVQLKNAHTGTYPVSVEGGESIIREVLAHIRETKQKMLTTYGSGSLKAVDEIEFYDTRGKTAFGVLGQTLSYWREELAANLGVPSAWSQKRAGGQRVANY